MPEYTKKDSEQESEFLLEEQHQESPLSVKTNLWDIAVVFTKLGAIAFGGQQHILLRSSWR